MKRIIEATTGSNDLTVLDLKEGYYQIEIEEVDKHKTAFEFGNNVYEWCGMIMGFKNAPMIFQRVINQVLEGLIGNRVEAYMDDIIIHSKDLKEHDALVREVIKRLSRNKLKVNMKKVQYTRQEVKLLSVTINEQDKIPNEMKKNEAL